MLLGLVLGTGDAALILTRDCLAAKSLDLSFQVNDFKALCHSWEKYKDELSNRCYVNIKDLRK